MRVELRRLWPWLIALAAYVLASPAAARDPQTLDALVAEVKRLQAAGAGNAAIARYVTGVIDRRITNGNGFEGDGARYWGYYTADSTIFDRWATYEDQRESLPEDCGHEFIARANWAWDLQYGHCAETSAIAYYVFKNAGISAMIMEVPGHSFTVIGAQPGARANDVNTWGPNAYIADGWYGDSISGRDGTGGIRVRHPWGRAQDDTRSDQTVTAYDSETRFEQCKHRGILAGRVTDANASPQKGAEVAFSGGTARNKVTTKADGTFAVRMVPEGNYDLSATTKDGASGSASAVVKGNMQLTFVTIVIRGGSKGTPGCVAGPIRIGGRGGPLQVQLPCPK